MYVITKETGMARRGMGPPVITSFTKHDDYVASRVRIRPKEYEFEETAFRVSVIIKGMVEEFGWNEKVRDFYLKYLLFLEDKLEELECIPKKVEFISNNEKEAVYYVLKLFRDWIFPWDNMFLSEWHRMMFDKILDEVR